MEAENHTRNSENATGWDLKTTSANDRLAKAHRDRGLPDGDIWSPTHMLAAPDQLQIAADLVATSLAGRLLTATPETKPMLRITFHLSQKGRE
jgi:hypothetical protein